MPKSCVLLFKLNFSAPRSNQVEAQFKSAFHHREGELHTRVVSIFKKEGTSLENIHWICWFIRKLKNVSLFLKNVLNISWHIFPVQPMIANKMHLISLQNQSTQYHTVYTVYHSKVFCVTCGKGRHQKKKNDFF